MTQDELSELLRAYEWRDVEFKEARRDVPRNAYETVSAFANTEGGHIVFGARKAGEKLDILGVMEVDKVQSDFLTTLNQRDKISAILDVREELKEQDGGTFLIFYIPEAHRSEKPVYLNRDIRRSFVRKGGCDVRCSDNERNRFLVDAATERYDGQPVDFDLNAAFDPESIKWYRATYENKPGNRSYAALSDSEFLDQMGLLVNRSGGKVPARAAILLFGTNASFRQLLPRPVVDCQRFFSSRANTDVGDRWNDRLVLEENLVLTWQSLMDWYRKFSDIPFRIDPVSLQREDTPTDYRAVREAMANLLIHQDYSDHARKPEIRFYSDQSVFWNPGDAFDTNTELLEPNQKEVRNPRIVTAFRRIGLSENAGWGLQDIFRNWRELGYVPPRITNNKGRKSFDLILAKEELLSEQQRLFQSKLGVQLTEEQSRAFAFACRESTVTIPQLKLVLGLDQPEIVALADSLVRESLLRVVNPGQRYVLAEHLDDLLHQDNLVTDQLDKLKASLVTDQLDKIKDASVSGQLDALIKSLSTTQVKELVESLIPEEFEKLKSSLGIDQIEKLEASLGIDQIGKLKAGLVTDQAGRPEASLVTPVLTKLTEEQRKVVQLCETPRRQTDLMKEIGFAHRTFFKKKHLEPLVRAKLIRMTHPDKPTHPNQTYAVTEAGLRLLALWRDEAENGKSNL